MPLGQTVPQLVVGEFGEVVVDAGVVCANAGTAARLRARAAAILMVLIIIKNAPDMRRMPRWFDLVKRPYSGGLFCFVPS